MAAQFQKKCRVLLLIAFVAFVIGMGIVSFYSPQASRYFNDPTLVATKPMDLNFPVIQVSKAPSVRQRLAYYKAFPPKRGNFRFSKSALRHCSIDGLLNQCHEVSGVQFFIDKHVASGSVMFGSTNSLNGPEWVDAFTNAVQTGEVQWWDANKKDFRKDNPVFVAIDGNTFLILPKERVEEYSKGRR